MIGKSSWFSPRRFGGWGLTPNCWQGWLYIAVFVSPIIIVTYLPISPALKNIITIAITLILVVDIINIFLHLKKDERETLHEAIADRNALWIMLAALAGGIVYQSALGSVDPIILIALACGVIVKALTHLYLRRR